ncbi:MAG: PDDEXK nuclease domain-containing protein [Bacteroidia bacterium]|nr:PDDEXK nuclease domain-containing protein [Bacteroidia bacterium]
MSAHCTATPLPQLTDKVATLASRVDGHVKKMGAKLDTPSRIQPPLSVEFTGSTSWPINLSALLETLPRSFTLGWSHYVELLTINDTAERRFYEIEADTNQWSVRELTHQYLGQMQIYVNYFDRHVKLPEELPTIGIALCHRKNDALVELTLPKDANIFASKYQLYLPSKEELKARLKRITEELEHGSRGDAESVENGELKMENGE